MSDNLASGLFLPTANVFLIGFSGAGKSAVGRALAERLGREFVDTDVEIVRCFDKSIERVFAEDGEARFREVEAAIVGQAAERARLVISLGGGAIIDPRGRSAVLGGLPGRSCVVWLDAAPEVLLSRLRGDSTEVRPLLSSADPLARIRELRSRREMAYAAAANRRIATDELSPAEVAERIASWLAVIWRQ